MTPSTDAAEPGHILVVDDNELNRDMLSRRLQRQGHTVDLAVNGLDALERLTEGSFDLVLLDLMMPEMNGFQLLERMKGDKALQHLPVILISALDDEESVIRGIEIGADDHLPKPFNPHILRARVVACLAKKRLRDRQELHARSLERELDIAREIQSGFLPDRLPEIPGWELAARFEPARSVGGDFYDAFTFAEGSRVMIVVADVCGKGVGAALFMALFRSLTRALAERVLGKEDALDSGLDSEEVRQLVVSVNDYIARTHDRASMFATMFVAAIDSRSGTLAYVNGGHEAAVLVGADGIRARLEPTGPAIGMLPDMVFDTATVTIAPGETLVVFTDGVTDATDDDGDHFTEDRLLALLAEPASSADETLERICTAVHAHAADAAFDDLTLFAVRRSES